VFATLLGVMIKTTWHNPGVRPDNPTTADIGVLFMKDFILPFEIASIFLLVALIGAAMIVRRKAE
jgi:NAD(P)H-quinone oxidoreductase subunit 6